MIAIKCISALQWMHACPSLIITRKSSQLGQKSWILHHINLNQDTSLFFYQTSVLSTIQWCMTSNEGRVCVCAMRRGCLAVCVCDSEKRDRLPLCNTTHWLANCQAYSLQPELRVAGRNWKMRSALFRWLLERLPALSFLCIRLFSAPSFSYKCGKYITSGDK